MIVISGGGAGGGLAGGALLPSGVTGLKLWLKGDTGVTLVSGKVSVWADQSGEGYDFIQTNAALRPTVASAAMNGYDCISFDRASTQWLYNNSICPAVYGGYGLPTTTFCVFRLNSVANHQTLLYTSRDDVVKTINLLSFNNTGRLYSGITNLPTSDRETRVRCTTLAALIDRPVLYTIYFSAATGDFVSIREGGIERCTRHNFTMGVTMNQQYMTIGMATENNYTWSDQAFDGEIAEVIAYNRTLTENEIRGVETYLMAKYAIPATLWDPTFCDVPRYPVIQPVYGPYNSPYNIDTWVETVIADSTDGDMHLFLPYQPDEGMSMRFNIRRTSAAANVCDVADSGGKKIEGSASAFSLVADTSYTFAGDGVDWWLIHKSDLS